MASAVHQVTSAVFSSVHSSQFSHTARKAVRLFLPITSNSPSSTGAIDSSWGQGMAAGALVLASHTT